MDRPSSHGGPRLCFSTWAIRQALDPGRPGMRFRTVVIVVASIAAASSRAAEPPVANEEIPPALSPEEALRSFRLKLGLRIELVAAEPLVVDPVAIDFGG